MSGSLIFKNGHSKSRHRPSGNKNTVCTEDGPSGGRSMVVTRSPLAPCSMAGGAFSLTTSVTIHVLGSELCTVSRPKYTKAYGMKGFAFLENNNSVARTASHTMVEFGPLLPG